MPNVYNGIIPFGSDDETVLIQCSCKDTDDITSKSGVVQTGAVVSSEGVTIGANGGILFDMSSLDPVIKAQMQYTGQVSFEIDAYSFATFVAEFSTAKDWATSGYFINWHSAISGATPYGSIHIDASNRIVAYISATADTPAINSWFRSHEAIASGNNNRFIVTLSWNGSEGEIYFNGKLAGTGARAAYTGGIFEHLMIGAVVNQALPATGALMSNVVMASRPVSFAVNPKLSNIVWYGDSFVDNSDASEMYGAGCTLAFDSVFHNIGLKCASVEAGVGGSTVNNTGTTAIEDQISGADATKPNLGVSDLRPKIALYRGWTNDAIDLSFTLADSDTDMKAQITSVLAVSDHIIIGTVPSVDIRNGSTWSGDATRIARVDTINGYINALPTWAALNGFTDRVHIVDQFTYFGGHNPQGAQLKWFKNADFHPNGFGQWKQGILFANEAKKLLS